MRQWGLTITTMKMGWKFIPFVVPFVVLAGVFDSSDILVPVLLSFFPLSSFSVFFAFCSYFTSRRRRLKTKTKHVRGGVVVHWHRPRKNSRFLKLR